MTQIPLTHGQVAIVDDEDYDYLSQFTWRATFDGHHWYARATISGRRVYLHRIVGRGYSQIDLSTGKSRAVDKVDHRDGDGLNNRRANLRVADHAQNMQNTVGRPTGRKSSFKGVSPGVGSMEGKWRASIQVAGQQQHLGHYSTERDAAEAYNEAAEQAFGEWARLNDIDHMTSTI